MKKIFYISAALFCAAMLFSVSACHFNVVKKTSTVSAASISVKTLPSKVHYCEGDELETEGLVLEVKYTNETTADVTEGFEVTGYDSSVTGTQKLTVSYKNKKTTFPVTVETVSGLVKVEGGKVVGSTSNQCWSSDYPGIFIDGRTVEISDFIMCDHEVTQGEYEKYCSYSGSDTPATKINTNTGNTYGTGKDYPVYLVTWYDAIYYCNLRSAAEGLTPCYSIVVDGVDETDASK